MKLWSYKVRIYTYARETWTLKIKESRDGYTSSLVLDAAVRESFWQGRTREEPDEYARRKKIKWKSLEIGYVTTDL